MKDMINWLYGKRTAITGSVTIAFNIARLWGLDVSESTADTINQNLLILMGIFLRLGIAKDLSDSKVNKEG